MIVSAFIFGLLSSLHCVGMCGPIAFTLPVHTGSKRQKWTKIVVYHLGRLLTYAAIGAVFGLFGKAFVLAGLQQLLSVISGVILIVIALFQRKILNYLEHKSSSVVIGLIRNTYQNIAKSSSIVNFFCLGLLNGLLPCGTVYIALIGAISIGSIAYSSFYMFVFGLGTLPLMFLLMGVRLLSTQRFKSIFRKAVPVMLLVVGTLFVLRGLGLGISFVSPTEMSLQLQFIPLGCH